MAASCVGGVAFTVSSSRRGWRGFLDPSASRGVSPMMLLRMAFMRSHAGADQLTAVQYLALFAGELLPNLVA